MKVWLKSLAYPSGEEGGKFLVQMITTCLRYTQRKGGGDPRRVVAPLIFSLVQLFPLPLTLCISTVYCILVYNNTVCKRGGDSPGLRQIDTPDAGSFLTTMYVDSDSPYRLIRQPPDSP